MGKAYGGSEGNSKSLLCQQPLAPTIVTLGDYAIGIGELPFSGQHLAYTRQGLQKPLLLELIGNKRLSNGG